MKPLRIVSLLSGVALIGAVLIVPASRIVKADDVTGFVVDVAVNHHTFAIVPSMGLVLQPEPLGPNRGTTFIVDGTVFAGGTLATGPGQGDPGMPGSIGKWSCKGIFTSDLINGGSQSADDVGFNTTQMFQFGPRDFIWTEGLEAGLGRQGVVTYRTILGGTGKFRGAAGEVIQEGLGTNAGGTPNIRLTFKLLKDR